jgi:hypothetical protein
MSWKDRAMDMIYGGSKSPSLDDAQYSPEVRKHRRNVLLSGFDSEGLDYDYESAEKAGIRPEPMGYNKGHMGSVAPVTPEMYSKYEKEGLPKGEAYMLLKGAAHPTHQMAVEAEGERGFDIKKFGDRYFSVPKKLPYDERVPFESEDKFFKSRPEVAGMAAEDDRIVMNPYSKLSKQEQDAVRRNEAYRIYMRQNNIAPDFDVTDDQSKFFDNTEYAGNPDEMRQTIAARILTGDRSVSPTKKQIEWAKALQKKAGF